MKSIDYSSKLLHSENNAKEKTKSCSKVSFAGRNSIFELEKVKESLLHIKRSLQNPDTNLLMNDKRKYRSPAGTITPKPSQSHKHLARLDSKIIKKSFYQEETQMTIFKVKNYNTLTKQKVLVGDIAKPEFDNLLLEKLEYQNKYSSESKTFHIHLRQKSSASSINNTPDIVRSRNPHNKSKNLSIDLDNKSDRNNVESKKTKHKKTTSKGSKHEFFRVDRRSIIHMPLNCILFLIILS